MNLDKVIRKNLLSATLVFGQVTLAPLDMALAGFAPGKDIEESQICSIEGIASGNVNIRMNNGAQVTLPYNVFNPDGAERSVGDYTVQHEGAIQFGGDYKTRPSLHRYKISNKKDQSIAYALLQECEPMS